MRIGEAGQERYYLDPDIVKIVMTSSQVSVVLSCCQRAVLIVMQETWFAEQVTTLQREVEQLRTAEGEMQLQVKAAEQGQRDAPVAVYLQLCTCCAHGACQS